MRSIKSYIDSVWQSRFANHALFWSTLLVTSVTMSTLNEGEPRRQIITALVLLPSQIAVAYLLGYKLIPMQLMRKRFIIFSLSFSLLLFVFAAIARLSIIYAAEPFIRDEFDQESILEVLSDPVYLLMVYIPAVSLFPIIFLAVKTIKDRFAEQHKIEMIEKAKIANELRFLKAQINPHFLFNTLNNLYSLTVAKSDKAPEALLKLSEMLDYLLYKGSARKVPIQAELNNLKNYISLEKLRYGDELLVTLTASVDNEHAQIAPLLLLSIVENAFKHGVAGDVYESKIDISLVVENNHMSFKVFNTKPKKSNDPIESSGLGANNIRRQLELIYPNQYHLSETDHTDSFLLSLEIELE